MKQHWSSLITLSMLAVCLSLLVVVVAGTISQLNAGHTAPQSEARR